MSADARSDVRKLKRSAGEFVPGPLRAQDDLIEASGGAERNDVGALPQHCPLLCSVQVVKMQDGNDALAVVEKTLHVHGPENLRVADASIHPHW
jgi:hypothetical protein